MTHRQLAIVPEPARNDMPDSVPCPRCGGSVPAESFVYWAQIRKVVWLFALCPSCGRDAKRQWIGPLIPGSRFAPTDRGRRGRPRVDGD